MKALQLRQIVDRTERAISSQLPAMLDKIANKSPLELNTTQEMLSRFSTLATTTPFPSKSEQERIIGKNDLVDLNYFERGHRAARSVCRVILRNEAGRQIGVASGFLVSPRLMLTNHHVFPDAGQAAGALAQFDYSLDIDGIERRGPSYRIRSDLFYHAEKSLDFAVVAIDGQPEGGGAAELSSFGHLRLNPRLGKINKGEFISIVQHPSGLPKQVSLRENKLLSIEADFLVYQSDTAQGSSGSPLFNDTWQVVGLHSAGVPKKNGDGQWLTKTGDVADNDTEDGEIDWIGNRGTRASRIVAALRSAPANALLDELLSIAEGDGETSLQASRLVQSWRSSTDSGRLQASSRISRLRVYAEEGGARIELPVGYVAEIDGSSAAAPSPAQVPAPALATAVPAASEAYKAPVVDARYANRKGYIEKFLSEKISLPTIVKPALAATMANGETAIPYQNFSIVMHKERRLAMFTACNVDATKSARKPDPTKTYSRDALGGLSENDVEMWVAEPRIDAKHQLPDAFFHKDRQSFDKGHVVRRDDVVWGTSYAQVRRANGDSFHVTNCSPQIAAFNQSLRGGDWGLLENMILKQAKGEKLVIFAGPVLDDARDKPFKGEDENGDELIVQIPSRYWKIVIADGKDKLESYGFILEQDLSAVDWEFDIEAAWVAELKPLSEIQALADFIKLPKNVLDADMHGLIEAEESLAAQEIRRKTADAAPPR